MVEDKGLSAGWIVFLIIVVIIGVAYWSYSQHKKKCEMEAEVRRLKEEEDVRRRQLQEQHAVLLRTADQCWEQYVHFSKLEWACRLSRKTLCDEGILYYYQQLWGFLAAGWDEALLASRLRGVIVNGLHNVLSLRMEPDGEGHYTFPSAPAPVMEKDNYLYRLGVDLKMERMEEQTARLQAGMRHTAREQDGLDKDPNGLYYRRLLERLLPVVTVFCEDRESASLPDREIIVRATRFRDDMQATLAERGIVCVAYADATSGQQEDWFIQTPATGMGNMPAIVRRSDEALYYKGVVYC